MPEIPNPKPPLPLRELRSRTDSVLSQAPRRHGPWRAAEAKIALSHIRIEKGRRRGGYSACSWGLGLRVEGLASLARNRTFWIRCGWGHILLAYFKRGTLHVHQNPCSCN